MKILLILPLLFIIGCSSIRGFPPTTINIDRVNIALYRGGQPNNMGIQKLKSLGIKTVINLRMPNDFTIGVNIKSQGELLLACIYSSFFWSYWIIPGLSNPIKNTIITYETPSMVIKTNDTVYVMYIADGKVISKISSEASYWNSENIRIKNSFSVLINFFLYFF